ncbi:MAG TPA: DUF123 domain-containing protein, partial [Methanocorpusculum sp.]|nr:DUF123 domain-containing protein [Methanocorpusculum sp.]
YRKPKWHIDYLMEKTDLIEAVYAKTKERLECALAQTIGGECIAGFGCSDCKCSSHLFCRDENPRDEITQSFEALSLTPVTYKVF